MLIMNNILIYSRLSKPNFKKDITRNVFDPSKVYENVLILDGSDLVVADHLLN